jgi:hypothetical protein
MPAKDTNTCPEAIHIPDYFDRGKDCYTYLVRLLEKSEKHEFRRTLVVRQRASTGWLFAFETT